MPNETLTEFLREVAKDPFAKQALADTIEAGKFPMHGDTIGFTVEGLQWMENREAELRAQAN
jgi:hypothetical protein